MRSRFDNLTFWSFRNYISSITAYLLYNYAANATKNWVVKRIYWSHVLGAICGIWELPRLFQRMCHTKKQLSRNAEITLASLTLLAILIMWNNDVRKPLSVKIRCLDAVYRNVLWSKIAVKWLADVNSHCKLAQQSLHTPAAGCIAASVCIAFSRVCLFVCLFVCLSVCPRSKKKTAWAIDTELSTCILYKRRSASIDPEVKRSKVKVTWLRKPSRSHGC